MNERLCACINVDMRQRRQNQFQPEHLEFPTFHMYTYFMHSFYLLCRDSEHINSTQNNARRASKRVNGSDRKRRKMCSKSNLIKYLEEQRIWM